MEFSKMDFSHLEAQDEFLKKSKEEQQELVNEAHERFIDDTEETEDEFDEYEEINSVISRKKITSDGDYLENIKINQKRLKVFGENVVAWDSIKLDIQGNGEHTMVSSVRQPILVVTQRIITNVDEFSRLNSLVFSKSGITVKEFLEQVPEKYKEQYKAKMIHYVESKRKESLSLVWRNLKRVAKRDGFKVFLLAILGSESFRERCGDFIEKIKAKYENDFANQEKGSKPMDSSYSLLRGYLECLKEEDYMSRAIQKALEDGEITITSDEFVFLLRSHKESYESSSIIFNKYLQESLPGIKESILQYARGMVSEVDLINIEKKLQEVSINVCDPLTLQMNDEAGHYVGNSIFISYRAALRKNHFITVLAHELIHAASGNVVIESTESDDYGIKEVQLDSTRVGLRFAKGPLRDIASKKSLFRWLNEAVTEKINIEITNHEKKLQTYREERALFNLLCHNGKFLIDETLFYRAYFENYNPELRQSGTGVPQWKKLWSEINNAYCPGFLRKFDQYIKYHGIKKAVEAMSSPDGIEKIKIYKGSSRKNTPQNSVDE